MSGSRKFAIEMNMLGNDDDDDLVPVKDDFVNAGMSSSAAMGVDPEHVFNQQVSSLQTITLFH